MEPRLNFYKSDPEAMKAMSALEQQIARSGLEKSLIELSATSGFPNQRLCVVH